MWVRATLHFDGGGGETKDGCRQPAAFAAILSVEGEKNEYVLGRRLLRGESHNQGEYQGLLEGLGRALAIGVADLAVYGDSELVIEHVTRRSKVKAGHLKELCTRAQELVSQFERVRFSWVPRERNAEADRVSTAVRLGDDRFAVWTPRTSSSGTIVRGSRDDRLFAIAATLDELARHAREMAAGARPIQFSSR